MKNYFGLCYLTIVICTIVSCSKSIIPLAAAETLEPTTYDEALAQKLGADEYGMKSFVIAFLKKGPNRDLSKEEAARLQRAHLDNISKLADEGKLVLAGPFYGDKESDLRGIYIFDVETIEEAEQLTNTDPAIIAGSLVMDLKRWYGSAATLLINTWHEKIQKTKI